jgi:hypothetical protein
LTTFLKSCCQCLYGIYLGGGGGKAKEKRFFKTAKMSDVTGKIGQKGKIEKFVEFDIAIINKPSKSGK